MSAGRLLRRGLACSWWCVAAAAGLAASCGKDQGTAAIAGGGTDGSGGSGGLIIEHDSGPPAADAGGLCGNSIHKIVSNAPNIVFVFDTSGSMATLDGAHTRFGSVRDAAVALVKQLGPLINPGAARFPANATATDGCHVGEIVMPVSPGDDNGPTTNKFDQSTLMAPNGGTPLASTMRAIKSQLAFVPGRTFLVLATDGAPNCNFDITCGADRCEPNIEGACDPSTNCCGPDYPQGQSNCVDDVAAAAAVKAYADIGIPVYVVGIPGSDVYEDVLDELAVAGGTARTSSPRYYKVDDLSQLQETFGSIASLAISCAFDIEDPPPEKGHTNVYLDSMLLPSNAKNGWTWATDTEVLLHGDACNRLKSGAVKQVQIVSGCPTVVK